MSDSRLIEVRDDKDNTVGSAKIAKNKRGLGTYLQHLIVKEEHRGRGYGEQIIDQITSAGPTSLEVDKSNEKAIRLYERKGFHVKSEIPAKNGHTYLRMKKD